MLDVEELQRRMEALRTLRGLTQTDLAELVHQDGHGKHDVGRLERGAIRLTPSLRRSLASHLRVSEQWFTEPDLDKVVAQEDVPAGLDQRLDRMQEILDYLSHWQEGEVLQRIVEYRTEAYGRLLERLEQIDRRLDRIEPSLTEDLTQLRRRWAQTLGQPASADQATPTADEPRDEGDAKPGAGQSRAGGKRAGGGRPGR